MWSLLSQHKKILKVGSELWVSFQRQMGQEKLNFHGSEVIG